MQQHSLGFGREWFTGKSLSLRIIQAGATHFVTGVTLEKGSASGSSSAQKRVKIKRK
jgi:hypothetical protein